MALRLARWTCALAALAAAVPAAAGADPAAGITGGADLALFDTANPAGLTSRPITGLQTGTEKVVGLDMRPATGQLFLVTVPTGAAGSAPVRSYTLDPVTATATFVGSITRRHRSRAPPTRRAAPTSTRASTGCGWSMRQRELPDQPEQRFAHRRRHDPDVPAPATDRSRRWPTTASRARPAGHAAPPGTLTTLYGIDVGADRLVTIGGVGGETPGGPNGGTVRPRARSAWRSTTRATPASTSPRTARPSRR